MQYASACLGVGIVSTMATKAGPRELPKPRKVSQPSYPPDHSPLIGTHSILFLWPWNNLQTQKQLHQDSAALSTNHLPRWTNASSPSYSEFSEGKHQRGPKQGWRLVIHAHSSVHRCLITTPLGTKGHLCWYQSTRPIPISTLR